MKIPKDNFLEIGVQTYRELYLAELAKNRELQKHIAKLDDEIDELQEEVICLEAQIG